MRLLRAHENGRALRIAPFAIALLASFRLLACSEDDPTRASPCTAPIAGVCTAAVPAPNEPTRAVGGGPGPTATTVAIPSGADAGVAMPQFEYGPDGAVRVRP